MEHPTKRISPPRSADRFLSWFCRDELLEEIKGDLHEFYREEITEKPRWKTNLLYWYHILHFLRPFAIKRSRTLSNPIMMYRTYVKYAFRSIRSNKFFSLINIIGLGIGLAACVLIFQYLSREWNYDKFHADYENIYRVKQAIQKEGIIVESATTFSSLALELKQEYPSVQAVCRLHRISGNVTVQHEEKVFREENLIGADSSFFELFQFPFLYGSPHTALQKPGSLVLTETIARKYFGTADPIGQEIIIDGAYGFWTPKGYKDRNIYVVTGVLQDLPEQTHLQFDFLISLNLYTNLERELKNWGDSFYTYFKVTEGTPLEVIKTGLTDIAKEYRPDQGLRLGLQEMQQIHLTSDLVNELKTNGNKHLSYLLALIAVIILIIAGTNYINFSTAKAINRREEVGVRKIFGAKPGQLFQQLLVESFILNVLAMLLALTLIRVTQPYVMNLLGFKLSSSLSQPFFWMILLTTLVVGTLISGLYPAYRFSRQRLGRIIGQNADTPTAPGRSRQWLVIFQFAISMLVIGCAMIMYRQMDFINNKDLGIDLERTLVINGPGIGQENDTLYYERINSFKEEALRIKDIRNISLANFIPGKAIRGIASGYVRKVGTPKELAKSYSFSQVGFDFFPNFNIDVVAGRAFTPSFASDQTFGETVIINQEACRLLGFTSPEAAIGQKILYRRDATPTIVGVVDDFHQYSLQRNFQPIIFEPSLAPRSYYYLKFSKGDNLADINALRSLWKDIFPGNSFSYFFLDNFYARQYSREKRFMEAFGLFTLLAILVASIGFFGLIYYSATNRIKEIGIRKTFGATFRDIFLLLSKGLGLFLLFAGMVSIPPLYFLTDGWLEDYAFRIDIKWWMLLAPVFFLSAITFFVITVQSLYSYRLNPVEALREE